MWGLASPLLGEDTRGVVDGFYEAVVADRGSWDALWLGGLEVDGLWLDTLIRRFGPSFRLRRGPLTRRHSASLDGGFDGFLGRRKRTFRKNLRRAGRRVQEAGLSFDHAGNAEDADAIYARIQAIEARSWKGKADSGISSGGMYVFYEHAVRLLVASGSLRAVFAVLDGRDVGFLFGGVLGDTFRGLQCSFDDDYRSLQLGNVLQATMIEALCSSGEVSDYDLGSDMPYKTRWAEGGLETVTLLVAGR